MLFLYLYPSTTDTPPPIPEYVTIGIPALFNVSKSRKIVRLETSNLSASSFIVILSVLTSIFNIPNNLSIFIAVHFLSIIY